MKTYIIYPINYTGAKAPGIAVTVENTDKAYSVALEIAKNRSRLSSFKDKWYFI